MKNFVNAIVLSIVLGGWGSAFAASSDLYKNRGDAFVAMCQTLKGDLFISAHPQALSTLFISINPLTLDKAVDLEEWQKMPAIAQQIVAAKKHDGFDTDFFVEQDVAKSFIDPLVDFAKKLEIQEEPIAKAPETPMTKELRREVEEMFQGTPQKPLSQLPSGPATPMTLQAQKEVLEMFQGTPPQKKAMPRTILFFDGSKYSMEVDHSWTPL